MISFANPFASDLAGEMHHASKRVDQAALERLYCLGATPEGLAKLGQAAAPFGIAKVHVEKNGLWVPGAGPRHTLVPVITSGQIVDLVAWQPRNPTRWHLRTGLGWLLGGDWLYSTERWDLGAAVPIYSTPSSWLCSGGVGICVTDWSAPELYELNLIEGFEVDDPTLARVLVKSLSKPRRLPFVRVKQEAQRHAA